MTILFLSDADKTADWAAALARELPDDEILIGAEAAWNRAADIDCAVVWRPQPGLLARLPALKAIFSLGAGVDHVFADPQLPPDVPIVRLIDPAMTEQMTDWVVMNVLRHHRLMVDYALQQTRRLWQSHDVPPARERRVGLMGLGVLGAAAAKALAPFGFNLAAWVREPRGWDAGTLFAGPDGLRPFLARTDIAVCLLPLTQETRGILAQRTFAEMPTGAGIINAARGAHVVGADLITALDRGQLSAATLDVFETEPLPTTDPLWRHPRVTVTPHVAAVTLAATAAREIAANVRNLRAGGPLNGLVERSRGY